MKNNFKKEKESISLMGEGLTTKVCRDILCVGTKYQKESVKNLFLSDNQLTTLPFNPQHFPYLYWLTLSNYLFIQVVMSLLHLKGLIVSPVLRT